MADIAYAIDLPGITGNYGSTPDTPAISLAGSNVLRLPGTTGNYASTPDTAANSLQGTETGLRLSGHQNTYASTPSSASLDVNADMEIRWEGIIEDWVPGSTGSGQNHIISNYAHLVSGFKLHTSSNSYLRVQASISGSNVSHATAHTLPVGTRVRIKFTRIHSTGVTQFYGGLATIAWASLPTIGSTGTIFAGVTIPGGSSTVRIGGGEGGRGTRGIAFTASVNIGGTDVIAPNFTTAPWVVGDIASTARSSGGNTWTLNDQAEIVATAERRSMRVAGATGEYASTPDSVSLSLGANQLTANQTSIETDATGWGTLANCTIARTTAQFLDGAASLEITSIAAGTVITKNEPLTQVVAAVGETFTARAWFRSAVSTRSVSVGLNWRTAAGAFLSTSSGGTLTTTTSGWTMVSVTAVAPASTERVSVQLEILGVAAGGEVHYADSIYLFRGTGDIDIRVNLAMDDWTPTAFCSVLSKRNADITQSAYRIAINSAGTLDFTWWAAGVGIQKTSTVATGLANGGSGWIRATLDIDNGAAGNDVKFYTSTDGVVWAQLGTTVTTAGVTFVDDTTSVLLLGNITGQPLSCNVFYAEVRNGINGSVVANPNFAALPWAMGETSGATGIDQTGNTWTLSGTAIIRKAFYSDLDIRAKIHPDAWIPISGGQIILAKEGGTPQRSFYLYIHSSAVLGLGISLDGTNLLFPSRLHGLTGSSVKWVRATRVSATGVVEFFLSDDGVIWNSLGTSASTSGALFDSTAVVEIGSRSNGTAERFSGIVHYAELRNGIDGTIVAKFDPSTLSPTVDQSPTTLLSTTGETWTMNGTRWNWRRDNEVRSLRLSGVAGVYASAPDSPSLSLAGNNVLRLPWTTGNYASTPDTAAVSITGDIDIRVKVTPDSWATGVTQALFSKYNTTGNQVSYLFQINTANTLSFVWSPDGTGASQVSRGSGALGFTPGQTMWVRVALDVDAGGGLYSLQFYTSTDGVTWTPFGAALTGAVTSIFDSTIPVEIGARTGGTTALLAGTIHYAEVRNGIGGTVVAKFDPSTISPTVDQTPTTLVSSTGETWTMNGTRWNWRRDNEVRSLRLTGVSGVYASAPDSAALSIVGDLDIRAKLSMDAWHPLTSTRAVVSKRGSSQDAYTLKVRTSDGNLEYSWWAATVVTTVQSTDDPTVVDGAVLWIRVTHDVDNGAAGNDVKFWTSTDGITWAQLGITITTAGVTTIDDTTAPLKIGEGSAGQELAGNVFYAEVRNNILNDGTGIVANPSFENAPWDVGDTGASTGTDAAGNTWTLNGAAIIQRAFNSDLDMRAKVSMDDWTPATTMTFVAKAVGDPNRSYRFVCSTSGVFTFAWYPLGTNAREVSASSTVVNTIVNGATKWVRATLDADNGAVGNDVKFYTSDDGVTWVQLGATVTTALATTIADTTAALEVGGRNNGSQDFLAGNVYAVDIRNNILNDGTGIVANPSFENAPWDVGDTGTTTGTDTASTANTWTLNGAAIIRRAFLADLDIRAKVTMDDWNTGVTQYFLSTRGTAGTGYSMRISSGGNLEIVWGNGSVDAFRSMALPVLADGATKWVRVTMDVDNGAGGSTRNFYTSDDGVAWTALGAADITTPVSMIGDSIAILEIGSGFTGTLNMNGLLYYAEVRNGIDGTIVAKFNPGEVIVLGTRDPSAFTTGDTPWTMSGSDWNWLSYAGGLSGSCGGGYGGTFYAEVEYAGSSDCDPGGTPPGPTSNIEEICRSTCGSRAI